MKIRHCVGHSVAKLPFCQHRPWRLVVFGTAAHASIRMPQALLSVGNSAMRVERAVVSLCHPLGGYLRAALRILLRSFS